jgi:HK97 family phage major capsid protein
MHRTQPLVRAASDSSGGTAEIAISSEYEVERVGWLGDRWIEVLDHRAEALVMTRAGKGLSLLREHDTRQVIGKVTGIRTDSDRVLRGLPKFSRSARGQEAAQDYDDDILTEVSVGYRIHEVEKIAERDGVPVYKATRWEPLEVSLVAVPADPTAGKGRSAEDQAIAPVVIHGLAQTPGRGEERFTMTEQTQAPVAPGTDSVTQRNAEVADIMAMCQQHGFAELAGDFIRNGASREQVGRALLERIHQRDIDASVPKPRVELTERERKRYSFARAIAQADPEMSSKVDAGFEREVSEEVRKSLPPQVQYRGGLLIPTMTRAGIDTSTTAGGDKLKFTQAGEFIELLRNAMALPKMGIRVLSGLTGPVSFPRQSAAASAAWSAENPGSDVADSNMTLDAVTLAFKSLGASTSFSRQLLFSALSGSYDAEAFIRDDLATVLALTADLAGIHGSGTSNQPTGVLATSGIGDVAGGTNGAAPSYANIVELETDVAVANAAQGSLGFLTNAKVRGKLRQTLENTTSGASYIWKGGLDGEVLGYPARVSNQVKSDLTKGTSTTICSAVVFGNWRELIMGEFGAIEVITDPYRLKKQAMIEVTAWQFLDFAVRHPASFSAMKDALTA